MNGKEDDRAAGHSSAQDILDYRHTQVGTFLIGAHGFVILVLGYLAWLTDFNPTVVAGLLVMLVTLGLFATLTVQVTDRVIVLEFGPVGVPILRKRFRLQEITAYQVVRNPWYYGWGIRYTARGWLFNVSGFSAIELEMKQGKRIRIGTDDPEGLAQAIERALARTS